MGKYYNMGEKDVLMTVATDSAAMYGSEFHKIKVKAFGEQPFDQVSAGEAWGRAILGANTGDLLELTEMDKHRIFNLGYYTWVEQRGLTVPEFDCRRQQEWWKSLHDLVPQWDKLIKEFNEEVAKTP